MNNLRGFYNFIISCLIDFEILGTGKKPQV